MSPAAHDLAQHPASFFGPSYAMAMDTKITKSDAEWRAELTPEQYHVLRQKGTERAFSGRATGTSTRPASTAAPAAAPSSSARTRSTTRARGWPSFFQPADASAVETETDRTFFMTRNEVKCATCGGHLGHVFDDGPAPTGQRYCINSAALKLEAKEG